MGHRTEERLLQLISVFLFAKSADKKGHENNAVERKKTNDMGGKNRKGHHLATLAESTVLRCSTETLA